VNNFSPLTSTHDGGPYLRTAPATTHYVIEYNSSGKVWVEAPGVYDTRYNPSRSFNASGLACAVGVPLP
jgi:hypothetical protein